MATIEELEGLYGNGNYREVIDSLEAEKLDPRMIKDAEMLLLMAWSYHQLGEYSSSLPIFERVMFRHSGVVHGESERKIELSACRGVAHGLLQTGAVLSLDRVEKIISSIPPSLKLNNVYASVALVGARSGRKINVKMIVDMIFHALQTVPHEVISGHIVNNGAFALFEAKTQEDVKPYLPILPGLMETAIGIYESTGAAKNHLAGSLYRAALIMEERGWLAGALTVIRQSLLLWRELARSQGGERYENNLVNAIDVWSRLERRGFIANR